jgi:hypothetical protein
VAVKHIDPLEMIQLTGTWEDPASEARAAILAVPDLVPLFGRMHVAHVGLADAMQPAQTAAVKAIIAEQATLDLRHDTVIRGIWYFLGALGDLLGGAQAVALIALRDKLIPDGLSSTQKTYRAESGQAAQLSGRLTPEIKAELDSIKVGPASASVSLLDFVNEWIAAGAKLGELEDKKVALLTPPEKSAAQTLIDAKNLWIRTMNALVANAELAGVDDATMQLVFGPLWAAEKAADKKARGKGSAEDEEPAAGDGAADAGAAAGEKAAGDGVGAEGGSTPAP